MGLEDFDSEDEKKDRLRVILYSGMIVLSGAVSTEAIKAHDYRLAAMAVLPIAASSYLLYRLYRENKGR